MLLSLNILIDIQWQLTVVLFAFLQCLLTWRVFSLLVFAFCISSFMKYLFFYLYPHWAVFLFLRFESSLGGLPLYQIYDLQMFPRFCLAMSFEEQKISVLMVANMNLFICGLWFWYHTEEILPNLSK